jgi:phosphoribosylglycinamide formyltransferase-1
MINLAIFASGSGSNAENIIRHFLNEPQIRVSCICTNRSDAYVIERAKSLNTPVFIFNRDDFYHSSRVIDFLNEQKIDWIILAGFLWLIPIDLINRYAGRMINIHPALLPKFGGKGMYGHHVHQAVIDQKEKHSGITIHYVDREYDRGDIIFQAKCSVEPHDTAESLAAKIHELEYLYFPAVIKDEILKGGRKQTEKH